MNCVLSHGQSLTTHSPQILAPAVFLSVPQTLHPEQCLRPPQRRGKSFASIHGGCSLPDWKTPHCAPANPPIARFLYGCIDGYYHTNAKLSFPLSCFPHWVATKSAGHQDAPGNCISEPRTRPELFF